MDKLPRLRQTLQLLDTHLGSLDKDHFVAGTSTASLADVSMYMTISQTDVLTDHFKLSEFVHVNNWIKRLDTIFAAYESKQDKWMTTARSNLKSHAAYIAQLAACNKPPQ